MLAAALNGAFPSLQARHEKQRLLFFAESLLQPHFWQFHKAARMEADLSVLGILWRIVWVEKMLWRCPCLAFGMSTEEDLGREDSTSSDRPAYIRSNGTTKKQPHTSNGGKAKERPMRCPVWDGGLRESLTSRKTGIFLR